MKRLIQISGSKTWVLADQCLVSGSSFLTTLLLARELQPSSFAAYAGILLAQLFLLSIQNALITSPSLVLLAHFPAPEIQSYLNALFYLQMGFICLLAGIGILVIVLLATPGYPLFGLGGWAFTMVGGYLLQDFFRRLLIARDEPARAFWIDLLSNAPQISILVWLSAHRHLQLREGLQIIGLTFLPSIALGCCFFGPARCRLNHLSQAIQLHITDGKWLLASSLLQWWSGNSFIVAAAAWLNVEAFAALRLVQNLLGVLNVPLLALENYLVPKASAIHQQDPSALRPYLRQVTGRILLSVIPPLLLLAACQGPLFRLAGGAQYAGHSALIPAFCGLYILLFIGYPVRVVVRVLRLSRVFFTGYMVSSAFSLLAARYFIRWWGLGGVVAGLFATQALMLSYWFWFIHTKTNFYANRTCSPRESQPRPDEWG